ncbi:hypothetical protein GCM10010306_077640 [Streptomyces umbrinus]|nr:hypothetical protein GCM10010306_077640 [Streptomyces umbrinus]GHH65974.1 hypothetical protein GCM10018775_87510 [Streptomyces umbrinus]
MDPEPSSPESDEPHAASAARPSPVTATTAVNFLVVLTGFLLGVTRKRRGPARDLDRFPGRAQQLE